ncbi:hypothetical protein SODALDRAFT_358221 [Sodiomyces alkalinus F11]|uniref:Uncharacterized protein n=1 Tax=Sodiomyces alkalinus (strain CBS 110278 / VKM F-3762 / F11) TaxID=1314773 RepID=A0A3N2PZM4_SODAK|nr:hypothetical protein SODALDRAFT_358221 [Sodiomyces alkalinus F11]ROT39805.1 hypothetical protein SODALDRAFT_358221 [Sodiomyces alkalinus F11]
MRLGLVLDTCYTRFPPSKCSGMARSASLTVGVHHMGETCNSTCPSSAPPEARQAISLLHDFESIAVRANCNMVGRRGDAHAGIRPNCEGSSVIGIKNIGMSYEVRKLEDDQTQGVIEGYCFFVLLGGFMDSMTSLVYDRQYDISNTERINPQQIR